MNTLGLGSLEATLIYRNSDNFLARRRKPNPPNGTEVRLGYVSVTVETLRPSEDPVDNIRNTTGPERSQIASPERHESIDSASSAECFGDDPEINRRVELII